MTTFQKVKLGDVYKFQYGKGNTNPSNGGKYPVYGAGSTIGYFDEYNAEDSPVIGHMGANCGTVIFGKGKHFVTYNGIMALIKNGNNSLFGYYTLLSKNLHDSIATRGSAQPFISYDLLNDIDIYLPDLPTQTRITSVLSAYDDLIENNEKRIKALEEMAHLLYIEWFVKFKLPGHEKAKMVNTGTEYGMIPAGWEVKRLGDLIQIKKGKNITKDTVTNGNIPVVAGGLEPAYFHDTPNTKSPVVTISASGANAGFTRLYFEDVWASDCSFVDLSVTPHVYFYYLFLKNKQDDISRLQRGSAQPHVYPKDLMDLKIIDPSEAMINTFNKKVASLFELIGGIKQKNQNLSKTRDLLIPQLVTGRRELK